MRVENILELIGHTPMLRLRRLSNQHMATVFIKLEKFNLGGSVKDRAVLGMLQKAREEGLLKEDTILVEPTSGNTGIALALVGNLLDIPIKIVMPETMSKERQDIIRSYGAELILSEGPLGMKGAIEKAQEMVDADNRFMMLNQFENLGNVRIHEQTTAQEILQEVPELDALVAGIGTGGTITGVGKAIKKEKPGVQVIGVEPKASAVLHGEAPGPHKIQGIGAGFIPDILELDLLDDIIKIDNEEAMAMTRRLAKEEGLLLGISSGAAVAAALKVARRLGPEHTVVVIAPDGGEKYLSMDIFGGE